MMMDKQTQIFDSWTELQLHQNHIGTFYVNFYFYTVYTVSSNRLSVFTSYNSWKLINVTDTVVYELKIYIY